MEQDVIYLLAAVVFLGLAITHRLQLLRSDRRRTGSRSVYLHKLFWGDFFLFCGVVVGIAGSPVALLFVVTGVGFFIVHLARRAAVIQESALPSEEMQPVGDTA